MTEPQKITYGGVAFNKADVKQANEKTFLGKRIGLYEIELKDGTIFSYDKDEQKKENQPNVRIDKNKVIFEGINKGKIFDTDKADNYELNGCQNTYVRTNHFFEDKEDADTVRMNDKELPNGKVIKSKENSINANSQDKVSGKNEKAQQVDDTNPMLDPTSPLFIGYN